MSSVLLNSIEAMLKGTLLSSSWNCFSYLHPGVPTFWSHEVSVLSQFLLEQGMCPDTFFAHWNSFIWFLLSLVCPGVRGYPPPLIPITSLIVQNLEHWSETNERCCPFRVSHVRNWAQPRDTSKHHSWKTVRDADKMLLMGCPHSFAGSLAQVVDSLTHWIHAAFEDQFNWHPLWRLCHLQRYGQIFNWLRLIIILTVLFWRGQNWH